MENIDDNKETCGEEKTTEKYEEILALVRRGELISPHSLGRDIVQYLRFRGPKAFQYKNNQYHAVAEVVRKELVRRYTNTMEHIASSGKKQLAYLSLEFLVGRSLQNATINMDLDEHLKEAVLSLGMKIEDLYEEEVDAGLGNGGLGRLAACFFDSLATMEYPAMGYGLRYKYGIFKQFIVDGAQVEDRDEWLGGLQCPFDGSPWMVSRPDLTYTISFGGCMVEEFTSGGRKHTWNPDYQVLAVAHDFLVPGFKTQHTIPIRLWESVAFNPFSLEEFNMGKYNSASDECNRAAAITAVLYPMDNHDEGKELRLKQQYLFCSASLQDVLKRFESSPFYNGKGDESRAYNMLGNFIAMQLNDTHPSLAIPELMRLLIDDKGVEWGDAWNITRKVFSYTNHTVLPEALEKWSVELLSRVLPRHLHIIYDINHFFLEDEVKGNDLWCEDEEEDEKEVIRNMSLVQENPCKMIKMASLCIVGSHAVNGVAALHTSILTNTVFPKFHAMYPTKFQNKTNGVTPRRWILMANPRLAHLFSITLKGDQWAKDLSLVSGLKPHVNDPKFLKEWHSIKQYNKRRLASLILQTTGVKVDHNAMFDVHIKRIHEYKRQLLNILSVIDRYLRLKDCLEGRKGKDDPLLPPRVILFAGKAAPGYFMAKAIIQLISAVGNVINKDPVIGNMLKVVFIPNYNVSIAEVIIPGSDVCQQTSTAGMEASGTGNMKFAMNGCLIMGTLDGANVEIHDAIGGRDNMFLFGAKSTEVEALRNIYKGDHPPSPCTRLSRVLHTIEQGTFGPYHLFEPILYSLKPENDFYLVSHDFPSYMEAQGAADILYRDDPNEWTRKTILSAASCGTFSSDRTITQYAQHIWHIDPLPQE